MSKTQVEPGYFDTAGLADYLKVSKRFIIKWRSTGKIPGVCRVGSVYRYRRNEIEKSLLNGNLLIDK